MDSWYLVFGKGKCVLVNLGIFFGLHLDSDLVSS